MRSVTDSDSRVQARLEELATAYALPDAAPERLVALLALVAGSPHALTTVRDPVDGVEVHIADSLAGLLIPAVRSADTIADLGSGAGFPGLVLATTLPGAHVVLVESVGKKAAFLEDASERMGLENVEVVRARAESWRAGIGACDVVTARALASLAVLLEYASPLLREGGVLVAWKGRRDPDEEAAGRRAAAELAMSAPEAIATPPIAGGERYLDLSRKVGPTPPGYPRREGMARKRPLGASGRG